MGPQGTSEIRRERRAKHDAEAAVLGSSGYEKHTHEPTFRGLIFQHTCNES
jgi:hypothetical protein